MGEDRKTGDKKGSKNTVKPAQNVGRAPRNKSPRSKARDMRKKASGSKGLTTKRKVNEFVIYEGNSGKSTVQDSNRNDLLVYTLKGTVPNMEYKKSGTPLHDIPFTDKINIIDKGFSKRELLELKDRYGLSLQSFSKMLDINERTIQNKSLQSRFTGSVAEKIFAMSELYSYALEVFEERDKYRKWLDTPNPIFLNKRPIELFVTILGMQQVRHEIGRVDYGVY